MPDIAIRHIEYNGFDILDLGPVNGCMADTNALFYEINELVVTSSTIDIKGEGCDREGTVSGTSDKKSFARDTIDVEFTLSYTKLISNGFGEPEFIDVKAESAHPDEHSYHTA